MSGRPEEKGKGHGQGKTDQAERMLLVSSDGHIGPPAERYREYMDPKYVADFDEWFTAYIPLWLTKGTTATESVKSATDA